MALNSPSCGRQKQILCDSSGHCSEEKNSANYAVWAKAKKVVWVRGVCEGVMCNNIAASIPLVAFLIGASVIMNRVVIVYLKPFLWTIFRDIIFRKNLYTYKTLVVLLTCLFEAVRTNPGYGMATLIYNNLINLILGTVMLLRSNFIIQEKILLYIFK